MYLCNDFVNETVFILFYEGYIIKSSRYIRIVSQFGFVLKYQVQFG